MNTNNCNEIAVVNYNNHAVFSEIINTLQRQLIDKGVLCKIVGRGQMTSKTTFYILFNEHQNREMIDFSIKYAIFNYEQGGSQYVKDGIYLTKMALGLVVFDYSEYNKKILEKVINKQIIVVPFSYHSSLTVLPFNTSNTEPLDILFYGVMNPHRQKYLDILNPTGYKVKFATDYSLFGNALYEELKNAKIVLNLHYYNNPSVLELSRIVPLIANHKLVLSERSDDQDADKRFESMVVFIDEHNIVAECKKYLDNPELRYQKIAEAFKILSSENL